MTSAQRKGWTRELPTEAGWYWYREADGDQGCMPWIAGVDGVAGPVVVEVVPSPDSTYGHCVWVTHMDYTDALTADNFPGEWCGPIVAPKEEG